MYAKYRDRVEFFMVYIQEAHPTDGWQSRANERDGVLYEQPKTLEDRIDIAKTMCTKLEITLPALVDTIDNKTGSDYSAAPDRLYLIGVDGKIVYQSAPGPRGFKSDELREAIESLLDDEE